MRAIGAALACAGVLWLATGRPGPAQSPTLSGTATAIDGDGLRIDGVSVRLWGIDAPEMDQTCIAASGVHYDCGRISRDALAGLALGKTVTCNIMGIDRYDRKLAECFAADRPDVSINAAMVRDGMAVAFERYARAYVADQDAARRASRGLWAGVFELPSAYRRRSHASP